MWALFGHEMQISVGSLVNIFINYLEEVVKSADATKLRGSVAES